MSYAPRSVLANSSTAADKHKQQQEVSNGKSAREGGVGLYSSLASLQLAGDTCYGHMRMCTHWQLPQARGFEP